MKNLIITTLTAASLLGFSPIAGAVVTRNCPKLVTIDISRLKTESRAGVEKQLNDQNGGAVNGVTLETLLKIQDQLDKLIPVKSVVFTLKSTENSSCSYRGEPRGDFGTSAYLTGTFANGGFPNFIVNLFPRDSRLGKEVRKLDFPMLVKGTSDSPMRIQGGNSGLSAYPNGQCDPENGGDCGFITLGTIDTKVQ